MHRLVRNEHSLPKTLRILDLCTGTGCIPLLFHHQYSRAALQKPPLEMTAVDVSQLAIDLAHENAESYFSQHVLRASQPQLPGVLKIVRADVLRQDEAGDCEEAPPIMQALRNSSHLEEPQCDVLVSNPPYISSSAFKRTTAPSVRRYEPKLALVPPNTRHGKPSEVDGDLFYPRLLQIAQQLDAKVLLFEVADLTQAKRVAEMAVNQSLWDHVEIWRDDPAYSTAKTENLQMAGCKVEIVGRGHGRSVIAYRGRGITWMDALCRIGE